MRYELGTGGESEPGLILVVDAEAGVVLARSSEICVPRLRELVALANRPSPPATSETIEAMEEAAGILSRCQTDSATTLGIDVAITKLRAVIAAERARKVELPVDVVSFIRDALAYQLPPMTQEKGMALLAKYPEGSNTR